MSVFACFCGKLVAPVCDAQTARAGLCARRALVEHVDSQQEKVQQIVYHAIRWAFVRQPTSAGSTAGSKLNIWIGSLT